MGDLKEFVPYAHFSTQAIHAGQEPEQWGSRAVVPPISMATTFKQDEPGKHTVCIYLFYTRSMRMLCRMIKCMIHKQEVTGSNIPVLELLHGVARWLSGRASDLRSKGRGPWVRVPAVTLLRNNLRQVVHTPLPRSRDIPRGGL